MNDTNDTKPAGRVMAIGIGGLMIRRKTIKGKRQYVIMAGTEDRDEEGKYPVTYREEFTEDDMNRLQYDLSVLLNNFDDLD